MTSHLLTSRLTVVRIVVTIITFWFAGHDVANAGETLQYNRDVRPILAEHCFACHGLDSVSREADLRLDRRDCAEGSLGE